MRKKVAHQVLLVSKPKVGLLTEGYALYSLTRILNDSVVTIPVGYGICANVRKHLMTPAAEACWL